MSSEHVTPGEAAKTEAARQAVMFAFTMVGAFVLLLAQHRIMKDQQSIEQQIADPSGYARIKMERALKAELRWYRVADWCWPRCLPASRWAYGRAVAARKAYEAASP